MTPTAPLIQVPVREFAHPETGSRITIHSMLHAAQPDFYADLRATLHAAHEQGTHIHFEGVQRPEDAELETVSDETREHAQILATILDSNNDPFTAIGLVLQRDHLKPADGWERHDISLLRAVRVYGPATMRQFAASFKSAETMFAAFTTDVLRAMLLQGLTVEIKVALGEEDIETTFPGVDRYMCALRETIALGAVDVQLAKDPAANVALVWGAGHLSGLSAGLAERGYAEKETRWVTAIDPATLPTLSAS